MFTKLYIGTVWDVCGMSDKGLDPFSTDRRGDRGNPAAAQGKLPMARKDIRKLRLKGLLFNIWTHVSVSVQKNLDKAQHKGCLEATTEKGQLLTNTDRPPKVMRDNQNDQFSVVKLMTINYSAMSRFPCHWHIKQTGLPPAQLHILKSLGPLNKTKINLARLKATAKMHTSYIHTPTHSFKAALIGGKVKSRCLCACLM